MTHAPDPNTTTVLGSLGSLGCGLYAAIAQVPGGAVLAVLGTVGSMLIPVAVELIRAHARTRDGAGAIAELVREAVRSRAEVEALRAENARLLSEKALLRPQPTREP
jgi:hypothetical protein